MDRNARRLLEQALRLPEADRAEIAGRLLQSIEPETEADVEAAWRQEIEARIAAIDAGESETVPGEEVHSQLRAKLREQSSD